MAYIGEMQYLTIGDKTYSIAAGGLTTETDPVFSASAAAGITSTDISNWNGKTSNTGTVTSVAAAGASNSGITISGSPITSSGTITVGLNLSTAINGLDEGTSPAQLNDYIVAQYAGGGTTTTSYHRRKLSNIIVGKAVADQNGYNIDSNYVALGENFTALVNGTDLNTITTPGNYRASSSTIAQSLSNCPITTWFIMRVGYSDGTSGSWEFQEIIQGNNGSRYYRQHNGGTWTAWQSFLSTSNYLPLTGGSVTGAVTFGSSVSADELTVGDLIVNGNVSFINRLVTRTGTLTTSGWSNNSQTITINGVTSSNSVLVSPAPASANLYAASNVICTAQGTNSLTFTCSVVPTSNLTVNVVLL